MIAIFRQLSQMTVSDFGLALTAFVGIQAITVYGGRRYSNLRCSHSEDRRAPDGMAVLKPVLMRKVDLSRRRVNECYRDFPPT